MVIVGAPRILMAMIRVGPLHIAAPAALGNDAGVIMALDHHTPVSVQTMMDLHAATRVVHRGDSSTRPLDHGTAASRLDNRVVPGNWRVPDSFHARGVGDVRASGAGVRRASSCAFVSGAGISRVAVRRVGPRSRGAVRRRSGPVR